MTRAQRRLRPKERSLSRHGVEFIASWEGFRATAYKPVSTEQHWTIGYGHYGPDVKPGQRVTAARARLLLRADAAEAQATVRRLVKVTLHRNEFDALVSLCFNIGGGAFASSTVLRELNRGHRRRAALAFLMWNKGGGRVLLGLSRRRHAERRLFLRTPPQ